MSSELNLSADQSIQTFSGSSTHASIPHLRDRILITGLRFYGYTGNIPAEKVLGQWFEVDFELWTDLRAAAKTDQLEDTHDYAACIEAIGQLVQAAHVNLIEKLVDDIANLLLKLTGVPQVRVRLTKCHPPIPNVPGSVAVEVIRP